MHEETRRRIQGRIVKELIENFKNEKYTCVLSISELVSKFVRKGMDPLSVFSAIKSLSTVVNIDDNTCFLAGKMHAGVRKTIHDFGLVDAFLVVLAKDMNAKIVTGDPHFKGMKNVIFI